MTVRRPAAGSQTTPARFQPIPRQEAEEEFSTVEPMLGVEP